MNENVPPEGSKKSVNHIFQLTGYSLNKLKRKKCKLK